MPSKTLTPRPTLGELLARGLSAARSLNSRICSTRFLLAVSTARVFLAVCVREGVLIRSAIGALVHGLAPISQHRQTLRSLSSLGLNVVDVVFQPIMPIAVDTSLELGKASLRGLS